MLTESCSRDRIQRTNRASAPGGAPDFAAGLGAALGADLSPCAGLVSSVGTLVSLSPIAESICHWASYGKSTLDRQADSGCQPAMMRTHSRARAIVINTWNSRRNSTTAESSPCCSNAVRITAACASLTQNIGRAWSLCWLGLGLDRSFHIRPGATCLVEF
jgi:hypothetical protein